MNGVLFVNTGQKELQRYIQALDKLKLHIFSSDSCDEANKIIDRENIVLVLIDLSSADDDTLRFCRQIKHKSQSLRIAGILQNLPDEDLQEVRLNGVQFFLKEPVSDEELRSFVELILETAEIEAENRRLKEKIAVNRIALPFISALQPDSKKVLVEHDSELLRAVKIAAEAANKGISVSISGEPGTGKFTLAKLVQSRVKNKNSVFVRIISPALPDDFFKSLLTYYTNGQEPPFIFDNVTIEGFRKGTLFFQDFHEIASDNLENLKHLCKIAEEDNSGKSAPLFIFSLPADRQACRSDIIDFLTYIGAVPICLSPLRQKRKVLKHYLNHFVNTLSEELKLAPQILSEEGIAFLETLPWKKNLHELKEFTRKLLVFGRENAMNQLRELYRNEEPFPSLEDTFFQFRKGNMQELHLAKLWLVKKALHLTDGNKSQAARHLGITYQGLLKILKKNESLMK